MATSALTLCVCECVCESVCVCVCVYVCESVCVFLQRSSSHTHLIPSDQTAPRAAPLQQCDAGGVCGGQGRLLPRGVRQQQHLARLPAQRQHRLGGVPAEHRGLVGTVHMAAAHTLPLGEQSKAGILTGDVLLLSDAQNNTGSDWALKFLGQDNAKQPGIT